MCGRISKCGRLRHVGERQGLPARMTKLLPACVPRVKTIIPSTVVSTEIRGVQQERTGKCCLVSTSIRLLGWRYVFQGLPRVLTQYNKINFMTGHLYCFDVIFQLALNIFKAPLSFWIHPSMMAFPLNPTLLCSFKQINAASRHPGTANGSPSRFLGSPRIQHLSLTY
jgi:hypothetical protein